MTVSGAVLASGQLVLLCGVYLGYAAYIVIALAIGFGIFTFFALLIETWGYWGVGSTSRRRGYGMAPGWAAVALLVWARYFFVGRDFAELCAGFYLLYLAMASTAIGTLWRSHIAVRRRVRFVCLPVVGLITLLAVYAIGTLAAQRAVTAMVVLVGLFTLVLTVASLRFDPPRSPWRWFVSGASSLFFLVVLLAWLIAAAGDLRGLAS